MTVFEGWGRVRGACGHQHRTKGGAAWCLRRDELTCRKWGDHTDRSLWERLPDGDWISIDRPDLLRAKRTTTLKQRNGVTNMPSQHDTFRPRVGSKEMTDDDAWFTVDTLLDRGQHLVMGDFGYPVPPGCKDEWRAFRTRNSYDEPIVVIQAKVGEFRPIIGGAD